MNQVGFEAMDRTRLCIFCGSSIGKSEKYKDLVEKLGKLMVKHKIDLVYGGASVGLMGHLADAVLKAGGQVFGVIPKFMMDVELAHQGLTQLDIVDSMHERKHRMYDLSHAFLAIPGGIGTLDELCEILTWSQLERHQKFCAILNFDGYFQFLLKQLDVMVEEGFLKWGDRKGLHVFQQVEEIGDLLPRVL